MDVTTSSERGAELAVTPRSDFRSRSATSLAASPDGLRLLEAKTFTSGASEVKEITNFDRAVSPAMPGDETGTVRKLAKSLFWICWSFRKRRETKRPRRSFVDVTVAAFRLLAVAGYDVSADWAK